MWGFKPLPWQENVLRDCLAINPTTGYLYYRNVGLSVPRQNGKTEIMVILIFIFTVIFKYNVKYSSYNGDNALDIFKRCIGQIDGDAFHKANSWLQQLFPSDQRSNEKSGKFILRAFDPKTGERLGTADFITRGGGKGRGGTIHIIFFDEAQEVTKAENNALSAATSTLKNGQVYYFGTPPQVESSATSGAHRKDKNAQPRDYFKKFRQKCLDGNSSYTAWLEWSVEKLVPSNDIEAMYRSNPSLGYTISESQSLTIEYLCSKMMDDEDFAIEHLGYWMSQDKSRLIDITRWTDLKFEDGDNPYPVNKDTKIAVAFKFAKSKAVLNVAVAYKTGDLPICVEVIDQIDTYQEWVHDSVDMLMDYFYNRNCVGIAVDGAGSETLFMQLQADYHIWNTSDSRKRQGKLREVVGSEMAQATSLIVNSVNQKTIVHSGDGILDEIVEDAGKRMSGRYSSAIGFESISGKIDTTPLEAAALALFILKNDNSIDRREEVQVKRQFSFGTEKPIGIEKKIF